MVSRTIVKDKEFKIMEFNEKLQQLRRQKGLTQEELAEALYVSRAAVSKWESGRGYPNIDSLKAIAKLFSVTVDELLSGDELLILAEQDTKRKQRSLRDLVFGLLDISTLSFLFLPFFGQEIDGVIAVASLLSLNATAVYLRILYLAFVSTIAVFGILTLALQGCEQAFWVRNKGKASVLLNMLGLLLFILSRQPYAAVLLLIFSGIKVIMLIKK